MKPPYCRICGKFLETESEGGLIYFKKTPKDKEWVQRMERIKGVGHPPYADWFCENHFKEAYELKDLTINEAVLIIKKRIKI